MTCADLSRIINSDQVQAKLRSIRHDAVAHTMKKNPLTNKAEMLRLNPFANQKRQLEQKLIADRHAKRAQIMKEKRSKAGRAAKSKRTKGYQALQQGLKDAFKAADDVLEAEARAGNYVPGETDEEEDDA